MVVVGIVLAIAVGIVVLVLVFKGEDYSRYKAIADPVVVKLEHLDAALDVSVRHSEYDYYVKAITLEFADFKRSCSASDMNRQSYNAIAKAVRDYVMAGQEWQAQIDNPYIYSVDDSEMQAYWADASTEVDNARQLINSKR